MAGYGYPSMNGGYGYGSSSGMGGYGSPNNPTINPVMPPNYNLGNGTTAGNSGGMLKGRLVSSLEEVKGALIDFDGSIHYFHDIASRKIYTKQFNMDGTTTILTYNLVEPVMASPQTQDYVTREEFNALLRELNELKGVQQNESTRITSQNESILSANDF